MELPEDLIQHHVRIALEEDLGQRGDLTSETVVPETARARGRIFAKQKGVLAGIALAVETFRVCDPESRIEVLAGDGSELVEGSPVLTVQGTARGLLAAERTALNFLQQLSGVASLTSQFVQAVRGTGAIILETRKTTPGLRTLQKYAVRVGGGVNHRIGLYDRILLKENHFALSGHGMDAAGYQKTVEQAVATGGRFGPVTVEVRNLDEARAAAIGGADVLLLDNMDLDSLHETVLAMRELVRGKDQDLLLEASGGITLETAGRVAAAGVDRLSVGALTHSAPALDLSMLMDEMRSA